MDVTLSQWRVVALEVRSFNDIEQGPELGAPGWLEDQPGCVCVSVYEWVVCVFVCIEPSENR